MPEIDGGGLVDVIDHQAAGRRVTSVRLRVGARHAVVPGALDRAFALIADGSVARDAAVDVVVTPATVFCRACGRRSESAEILAVCPDCGDTDVDVTGDELVLEGVRFAPDEDPCPAGPRPGDLRFADPR
ncbi:MAG: hydrogenase maturation nickel metallochaperone HypA [Micromonosporaceae bacterium]|jgi:hydrogenase nickel incorporation protein HypA/HybF